MKTIRQERTSSKEKSDGFHLKCSIELWTTLMFELLLCSVYVCVCMCVCVCVCGWVGRCGCVCVCGCVYTLPPVGFFRLHDIFNIHEKFRSMIFCCEYSGSFCQVPSSLFLILSYFTSKDKNSSHPLTGKKAI